MAIPRNIDSIKNANTASIARGLPKTSPTKREYTGQFVPNSNSSTIPVTTPIANITAKSFKKNFAAILQISRPERKNIASIKTINNDSPIVIGGNKK